MEPLVNILNGLLFSYVKTSKNIEIFDVKLRLSESSRLLQRVAFLVSSNISRFFTLSTDELGDCT